MKRIILGISVVLVVFMSGFLFKSLSTATLTTSSIEDALKNQWGIIGQTIHIEPIEDQVVVFSKKGTGDNYTLRSDFVRKNLFGWKWVWGGAFGGYTGQYIEQVPGVNSPLIWGELRNNEIQKVKVTNVSKSNSYETKIISHLNTRIWFVFPRRDDKVLNIEGISEIGEVIDSQKIDISKDLHPDIMFGDKIKTEGTSDLLGVSMYAEKNQYPSNVSEINVVWKNDTDKELTFGDDFSIRKLGGQEWKAIGKGEVVFNTIGHIVSPHSEVKHSYNIRVWSDKLDEGTYRIVTDFLNVHSPGNYDTYNLTTNFTVK